MENLTDFQAQKQKIREQAHAARNALTDKDLLSDKIMERFLALEAYQKAKTVMIYIDVRAEVRTRQKLPEILQSGKKVIVPWCNEKGELELFRLDRMEELAIGMYKILEPKVELRSLKEKQISPEELDLVMVPGVAFDKRGARMGHGKGYYDKLLQHARSDTPLIALAFECQLFPEIPVAPHDIFMDQIITELKVYTCLGRTK